MKPRLFTSQAKRMTIAAGMLCGGGIVFGADTEESVGYFRLRAHKIPTNWELPAMITGACENGNLMDAAVERIFDGLGEGKPGSSEAVGKLLADVMVGLYQKEFGLYPDVSSTRMQLLVAVRPSNEKKASGWAIDCSSVRRMKPLEIEGTGVLVRFLADQFYRSDMSVESGILAMVQVLTSAKKRVAGVGGDSYVHVLRDDGSMHMKNFRFSPEVEGLYEFFVESGRGLMLATADETVTDDSYDKLAATFFSDLKCRRERITRSNAGKSEQEQ